MSKKLEAKADRSKFNALFSNLIDRFQNCRLNKLKSKQTAPLGIKSEKNFNPECENVQKRSNSIHSKEDASVSAFISNKSYLISNDTESLQLCEDLTLQKYEVKAILLKENLDPQNTSCQCKEVGAIASAQSVIIPSAFENGVKLNNFDTDKSLNVQSEAVIVSLFGKRSIKTEPVVEHDDESEISFRNTIKDGDRSQKGQPNQQNITCLVNRIIKGKEIDEVNYKEEIESDDENIFERGTDKTPKIKERHSEYPTRRNNRETDVRAKSHNATFPVDIESLNLHIELERLIADIEIESRIAKIKVDSQITNCLCNLFGPSKNFVQHFDSFSNPAINSQELKTKARCKLFISENFSQDTFFKECSQMYSWIQGEEFISNNYKVIHYLKLYGRKKYRRTNLHDAVMKENLEKTLCTLEIHKWYHNDLFEINAKDSSNPKKTALDWAYETRNCLLIDYLEENLAKRAVYITPINTPGT